MIISYFFISFPLFFYSYLLFYHFIPFFFLFFPSTPRELAAAEGHLEIVELLDAHIAKLEL